MNSAANIFGIIAAMLKTNDLNIIFSFLLKNQENLKRQPSKLTSPPLLKHDIKTQVKLPEMSIMQ